MILTTHALTGAVIGKNVFNQWFIILLSIAVHFIMDAFRHGEYVEVFNKNTSIKNSGWKVLLDLTVGLFLIILITQLENTNSLTTKNIVLGGLFSILPDFITAIFWKFRWKFLERYYAFHSWLHKYPRYAPEREWNLRNSVNDFLISALAIIFLFIH